ncbi:hypothetical protein ACH5RR_030592 [Cinchona calisaya]|uniref:Uncharacterized protein n=1 Tax=Cinchona calisaya TaxID=153742 RepID=A0ABD2YV18_9GENT
MVSFSFIASSLKTAKLIAGTFAGAAETIKLYGVACFGLNVYSINIILLGKCYGSELKKFKTKMVETSLETKEDGDLITKKDLFISTDKVSQACDSRTGILEGRVAAVEKKNVEDRVAVAGPAPPSRTWFRRLIGF